jgi:hypothetical protein
MASKMSDLIVQVRDFIVEPSANYWTDAELLRYMTQGAKNMWGAILNTYGDQYLVVSRDGSVFYDVNSDRLSGVPKDCFRVHQIEPVDTTSGGQNQNIIFVPKKFNHPDFTAARSIEGVDPSTVGQIYYDISGVGAPNESPMTILCAPRVTTKMPLLFAYNRTLGPLSLDSINPIAGESDMALIAWTVAFALGKEQASGQRIPDAGWLTVYSTEKSSVLSAMMPRQDQEPEVVDGLFDGLWGGLQ